MSALRDAQVESFAAALVEAGADAPFRDTGGQLYWLVPWWIVQAYARARLSRADVRQALAVEAVGEAAAVECRAHPEVLLWTLVAAWTARLGELERIVRGAPARRAA